jgi:integrase
MPTPTKYTATDGTASWRVRFRMGGRQTSETFHTERAAQIFCNDIAARGPEAAVRMRDEAERERRAPTLDAMSEAWLKHRTGRVRSDRTISDYRRDYRRHIAPTLGHRSVATITTGDVQRLVESWVGAGLAPRTILGHHAILHGIIKHAMTPLGGQWVDADPCIGIDLPRKRKTPPKALRPGEWAALHAALRQIDPHAADLAQFLVASGLRWSEAVALDGWSVDDHGHIVTVTVGRVLRRNAAGQHVIVDDTKAEASARTVKLDPGTSVMVRARAEQSGAGLLFTNARGHQWHYSNFADRAWRPAISLANLDRKPTVHWLRHTATIWALHSGASLADVQARLGHSSITTTIGTYGSSITDVGDEVLTGLGRLVSGGRVPALD